MTDGERKLRFRGLKKENWKITPLVQVGTDADIIAEGYEPGARDGGVTGIGADSPCHKYVEKHSRAYEDGSRNHPYKTIGAAINNLKDIDAYNGSITILDDGVYEEYICTLPEGCIDIHASPRKTPTIKCPNEAVFRSFPSPPVAFDKVKGIVSFVYNNSPCLYAVCEGTYRDILFRKTNTSHWEEVHVCNARYKLNSPCICNNTLYIAIDIIEEVISEYSWKLIKMNLLVLRANAPISIESNTINYTSSQSAPLPLRRLYNHDGNLLEILRFWTAPFTCYVDGYIVDNPRAHYGGLYLMHIKYSAITTLCEKTIYSEMTSDGDPHSIELFPGWYGINGVDASIMRLIWLILDALDPLMHPSNVNSVLCDGYLYSVILRVVTLGDVSVDEYFGFQDINVCSLFAYGLNKENGKFINDPLPQHTTDAILDYPLEISFYCILKYNNEIYALTGDGIYKVVREDNIVKVVPFSKYTWKSTPCRFLENRNEFIVICEKNIYISRDAMYSWAEMPLMYDTVRFASGERADCVVYGNSIIALTNSGEYVQLIREHIYSNEEGIPPRICISGCILDGQNTALSLYSGGCILKSCRVQRYGAVGSSVDSSDKFQNFHNSIFLDTSILLSQYSSMNSCECIRTPIVLLDNAFVQDSTIVFAAAGLTLTSADCRAIRCIIAHNGVDVVSYAADAKMESCYYNTALGTVQDVAANGLAPRYSGDPLFMDAERGDLRLKSRARGCLLDSGLLRDVTPGEGVELQEIAGARRYSHKRIDMTYGIDYTVALNPDTIAPSWQAANYNKIYSASGALYGSETHPAAYKVTKKLSWTTPSGRDHDPAAQAAIMRLIYALDTVYDIGETRDGIHWYPRFTLCKYGAHTCARVEKYITIAPNEYAGAWCIDGSGKIVGRIIEHSAIQKIDNDNWGIYIDWGNQDIKIEGEILHVDAFRRYRVDKSQPFAVSSPVPYAPGRLPEIPTQYEITIVEVDE